MLTMMAWAQLTLAQQLRPAADTLSATYVEDIRQRVEDMDRACPVLFSSDFKITSVKLDHQTLQVNVVYNDMDIESGNYAIHELNRMPQLTPLVTSDLFHDFVRYGLDFRFVLIGNVRGARTEMLMNNDEMSGQLEAVNRQEATLNKRLERKVRLMNLDMPITRNHFSLENMTVENDRLRCLFRYTDDELTEYAIRRAGLAKGLLLDNHGWLDSMEAIYQLCVETGKNAVNLFVCDQREDTVEVSINGKELIEALDGIWRLPEEELPVVEQQHKDLLQHTIEEGNKPLPQVIGEGMTMTRVYDDGQYFTYEILMDENDITVQNINDRAEILRINILNGMINDRKPSLWFIMRVCLFNRIGLAYRYVGKRTKAECEVLVSYSDLLHVVNQL